MLYFSLSWGNRKNYHQTWRALVPFIGWVKVVLERTEELEFCSLEEILEGIAVEFSEETKEDLESSEVETLDCLISKRSSYFHQIVFPYFPPFEEEYIPFF